MSTVTVSLSLAQFTVTTETCRGVLYSAMRQISVEVSLYLISDLLVFIK